MHRALNGRYRLLLVDAVSEIFATKVVFRMMSIKAVAQAIHSQLLHDTGKHLIEEICKCNTRWKQMQENLSLETDETYVSKSTPNNIENEHRNFIKLITDSQLTMSDTKPIFDE